MREMPIAPQRLRNPDEHADDRRGQLIGRAPAEQRAMDGVVGDRVRCPPHRQREYQRVHGLKSRIARTRAKTAIGPLAWIATTLAAANSAAATRRIDFIVTS